MDAAIKSQIIASVWDKLATTTVECPACKNRVDDPQYTCEICWCQGGDGTMALDNVIRRFTVQGDFED